jgi:hypothetical protein
MTTNSNPVSLACDPNNDLLEGAVVDALLLDMTEVAPPPARAQALRARLVEQAHASARMLENTITVYAEAGEWQPVTQGVRSKKLYSDGGGRSFLLRLDPGAVLPTHAHDSDEECLVLEGEVQIAGLRMGPGDYQLACSGSSHAQIASPTGALLFIRSHAGHDYQGHGASPVRG